MRRSLGWLGLGAALLLALPAAAAPRFDLKRIAVGAAPEQPLVVPAWERVFVPLGQEPRIAVIDSRRDLLVGYIATEVPPDRLAFDAARGRLIAVMRGRIEVFEPRAGGYERVAVVANHLVDLVHSAELDPRRGTLIATDRHRVGTLDLATLRWTEATTDLGGVNQLQIESSGERVLVAEEETNQVVALSADLVQRQLSVQNWRPASIGYSPARDRIYAVNPFIRLVQIIDPTTGDDEHAFVDEGAMSLVVDDATASVWVGHRTSRSVVRVRTDTLASRSIALPATSAPVVLDATRGQLFALAQSGAEVSVVDTGSESCEASYAVGPLPRYATVDPGTGKLYVASFGDGSVSILRPLPDPDRSEFSVNLEYIDADGVSVSRATAVPRDSSGNPLGPGRDVELRTTAGVLVGKVVDQGDGSYWQDLRSTGSVETAILSATVDTVAIRPRPRVSFTRTGWPDARVPEPEWGLTAGFEKVVIHGRGFASQLRAAGAPGASQVRIEVYFDGRAARVGSFTDTEIECWTPPHAAGVVDLSVVKYVGDERREAVLRQGFTYVEFSELSLLAGKGEAPGEVRLVFGSGPTGPVTMERSSHKDFSADVTSAAVLQGPEARDTAPTFPRVLYYRIGR